LNVFSGQTTQIAGVDTKMQSFVDLSGLLQYNVKPRIDFQLKFNNLLNNTNPRWYGYSNFGTNFVAVISYKFK
jgi:outer membrane receptor protein involved in Fe transport